MATGELSEAEQERVNAVVSEVEEQTGLEFCVMVTSRVYENARHGAEKAFHKLGLHQRPGVMIMVVPHARKLEVVTAPELANRLTDEHCARAVDVMTTRFRENDIAGGLEAGIRALAESAGPRSDGQTGHDSQDLPNILDLDDPNLN